MKKIFLLLGIMFLGLMRAETSQSATTYYYYDDDDYDYVLYYEEPTPDMVIVPLDYDEPVIYYYEY